MKYLKLFLLFFTATSFAQLDANSYTIGLPKVATTAEMNSMTGVQEGAMLYNEELKGIYIFNGSNWGSASKTNWLITGNLDADDTNFLGTINDVKMQIRSNNLPMLEFGRRQTLGLTQNYPGYENNDQPLVHLNGNGVTSALQFASQGANFYKPMFFTTANGSFRLKGSSGGTDLFEIGSAGPNNDGSLEFIIGDDGGEPIIFKRYDYRLSEFYTELFRVQGSNNTVDAKPRFGININPQRETLDPDYDNSATTGDFKMANSTLQVGGSISTAIIRTTGNLTLTEEHYTVIITGAHNITLPSANTCTGRIYVIKNISGGNRTISPPFKNLNNNNNSVLNESSVRWLQSDGFDWQQIK
ncbi:hypothetical protein [Tenacibaculum sp. SG-28]|uniref:hypothetical protein n=1 Tax=Tenacibaculum sp. SG-28 TaxID=754426 RepID=UPI000CF36C04|nr:hypothetical protein [Tenacibaculum sp. SG-28]PQJ19717.1 hypothetical protein BSU00_12195 [Tenacibaculum sp. SG-28]